MANAIASATADAGIASCSAAARAAPCASGEPPWSVSSLRVKPGLTTVTRMSRLSCRSPSGNARTAKLRRAVDRGGRIDALPGHRRHVHDVSRTPLPEMRQQGGYPVEGAAQVDVDHLLPPVDAQLGDRRQRHHARVVDQHVDPAVPVERGGRERANAAQIGHIQRIRVEHAAGRAHFVAQLGEPVGTPRARHDQVTCLGKTTGGSGADAAARTGYQNDFRHASS